MPVYSIKSPSGEEYEVNAPEGATQEQAFEFFKREYSAGKLSPTQKEEKPSALKQFGKDTVGTLGALGDIVAGVPKAALQLGLTAGSKLRSPSHNMDELWNAAGQTVEDLVPSIGRGMGLENNPGYQTTMTPFQKLGEAIDYSAKKVSLGNKDVEGAIKGAAAFLEVPGARVVGKGLKRAVEAIDPSLRHLEYVKPEPLTPERAKPVESPRIPEQMELPLENSLQHAAEMQARAGAQRDLFSPVNEPLAERVAPVSPDEMRQPIPVEEQGHLPFDTSPEEIAARQAEASPQRDMFAEDFQRQKEYDPYQVQQERNAQQEAMLEQMRQEEAAKPQDDMFLDRQIQQENVAKQATIEEAYKQREQQLAQEKQQATFDEQQGSLDTIEQQLREQAYQPPTQESLRAERGRPVKEGVRVLGNKQRGAVDLGGMLDSLFPKKKSSLTEEEFSRATAIPNDPVAANTIANALKDKSSQRGTASLGSGATMEAMKRGSVLLKDVGQIVQNWGKRSDLWVRQNIFQVENSLRRLTDSDFSKLANTFKQEMFSRERLPDLDHLTQKQRDAYAEMRDLFDKTLSLQNEARAARGEPPITMQEAYVASRWKGDFKLPVYNKEGNLVWYLAADSKFGLRKQIEALKKKDSSVVIDMSKAHTTLDRRGSAKGQIQSTYSTMLDILGRDDPAVQRFQKLAEEEAVSNQSNVRGQQKHFEPKGNIRGFVGDRPGVNAAKDAKAMFEQQIQYAKNASMWAEVQKGSKNLSEILNNPELMAQQPKNVQYAKDYVKHALGESEHIFIRDAENWLGNKAGISPNSVKNGVNNVKAIWVTQKLAASVGFTLSNLVFQPLMTIAHHVNLGSKGASLSNATNGFLYGSLLGSYHTIRGSDATASAAVRNSLKALPDHMRAAFEYAENNSVTNRGVYDETPVGNNTKADLVIKSIGKTISVPDTFSRSMAYMSFVDHLYNSGQYPKSRWNEMFQKAEELTNVSVVDPRPSEGAMAYGKGGITGSLFNTLTKYPINFYNQMGLFTREAFKGNPLPLFTFLAVQATLAGAMGMPGFQDIDAIWTETKKLLPTSSYLKVKDLDLKQFVLETAGTNGLYGPLSEQTGVAFTTRLSAASLKDVASAPGGMVKDLYTQIGSLGSFLSDPTNTTKGAQAVLNSIPPGLKELVAQNLLEKQTQSDTKEGRSIIFNRTDLADRKGMYARDAFDKKVANYGLRSQDETVVRDLDYLLNEMPNEMKQRQKDVVKNWYDAIRRGNSYDVKKYIDQYVELGGDPSQLQSALNKNAIEEFTTASQRNAMSAKKDINKLKALALQRKILEEQQ